jgi:hypothetical protein
MYSLVNNCLIWLTFAANYNTLNLIPTVSASVREAACK